MMINIRDHYWSIGNSPTDVYQSKSNTLVLVNNADYVAWMNLNGAPSPIATVAELAEVLKNYGTPLPLWLLAATPTFIQPTSTTYSKPQLSAYSADARYRRSNAGIVVTSISAKTFASDTASRNSIDAAYSYTKENPAATQQWKMTDGSFVTLNAAGVVKVMNAMALFAQNCYTCESTTNTSITSGTITTLAQIDTAFAGVSNTFP
jgi:hypothetical protein